MRAGDSLFAGERRLVMDEAVELTVASLNAYAERHRHWAVAWSGGKDSTATLTLLLHLVATGRVPAPDSLRVFYADTRLELPPLAAAAAEIITRLGGRNDVTVEVVRAQLDRRFLVYILGRGVPPPNNNTLRWCTRQIKVEPMQAALEAAIGAIDGDVLMITGVRQGESAIRDRRIVMSCGKDGAECGQGWYQQVLPEAKGIRGRVATLAPILHWRVCHVWDWLMLYAPSPAYGGWPTKLLADAYGGEEAEEINARTGCTGCPLASRDTALDAILAQPQWSHLAPLQRLRPLWRELRRPKWRLRKAGREIRKDGSAAANPQRLGPLTFEARLMGLAEVLAIQGEVNTEAMRLGRPVIDFLDGEEEARIRVLITAGTWPQGWDGDEPIGDVPLDTVFRDGSVQPLLM